YRFVPTCKELVTYYLRNKILERPLPPSKIREANIYKHSPTELSEKYDKEGSGVMYFFTPRDRKYPEGERPKRSVDGNGFWKASGKAEEVENFDILIAKKRSLVYYQGSYKKPKKTDWLMQEFFMTGSSSSSARKGRPHNMKLDDWVLCKVYKNKKRDKEEDGGHPVAFPNSSTVVGESSELPMMQKLNSNVPAQSLNLLHRSQAMHAISSQMSTYNNGQNGFQMPAAMLHSHEVQATSSQMPMYYNGQNFLLLNGGHEDTLWQQNNSHHHVDSKTNNQPEGIDMINN
ncbi:hypothetical protein CISIN_1g037309mg, partial [Citrus sinensis]